MIRKNGLEPNIASLGNSGSLRYIMLYAIEHFAENEIVYLLEDDYLYLDGAANCIEEGLDIADYVTLYDHPDKCIDKSKGVNPFMRNGGERLKVFFNR